MENSPPYGGSDRGYGQYHHECASNGSDRRCLGLAFLLIASYTGVEIVGAVISGSLALLSDAAHMATDAAALGLAWWAVLLLNRPGTARMTFGFRRAPVLAAFVNALFLIPLVIWILYEAFARIQDPQPVLAAPMLAVAVIGLLVNIVVYKMLHGSESNNLNIQAATLHVLGDMLGSIAAIVAAFVIWMTGWTPIDPILSLLVACVLLRSAWPILRDSAQILMESAPADLSSEELAAVLQEKVESVNSVDHVHIWSVDHDDRLATLHLKHDSSRDAAAILSDARTLLSERFAITHATIQLECDNGLCDAPGYARPAIRHASAESM